MTPADRTRLRHEAREARQRSLLLARHADELDALVEGESRAQVRVKGTRRRGEISTEQPITQTP